MVESKPSLNNQDNQDDTEGLVNGFLFNLLKIYGRFEN